MMTVMWLFACLTGGRPMLRGPFLFTDVVEGREIYIFRDSFGRRWMAERPWSWFRVRVEK